MTPNGTLSITAKTATGSSYTENMGNVKAEALHSEETQKTFASELDKFARGVISLSKNTYDTSTVTFKYDITEILAD